MVALQAEVPGYVGEIDRLDHEIGRLAPLIDPEEIRARRRHRSAVWPHGDFTRALAKCLSSKAEGVTTTEVLAQTAKALGIPLSPMSAYQMHYERVRRQLRKWVAKGWVERLHDITRNKEGRWRLTGHRKPLD